ncbi:MAG: transposase [Flavihumibacter sp.]|nr:transposase [Flavihumibacter sp.]
MGGFIHQKALQGCVVDAFNYCVKEKQLQVHAWCIMSNHVHCIITSRSGALSDTVRDLKRLRLNQFYLV